MNIPRKAWTDFARKLAAVNETAAQLMWEWLKVNGTGNLEAAVQYAFALAETYGEAAAALACEMYDAAALFYGATVPPAIPADGPVEERLRAAIEKAVEEAPVTIPAIVGRTVKQQAADTTLQNAQRDGAEWAWVPNGDTCAFCITLASNGWQHQSKAAKRAHAEHIHNNCDCTYAVRFSKKDGVEGYDDQVYKDMYYNASESQNPKDKINAMRRENYETDERLRAQKHEYYEAHKETLKAKREAKLAGENNEA